MTLLRLTALGLALSLASLACGADRGDDDAETDGALVLSSEQKDVLDALRARVTKDFANVASLRGKKLVFYFNPAKDSNDHVDSNGQKAVVFGTIMKRDASGNDFNLTNEDYKGSAFEERIRQGGFDGPLVYAVLEKSSGAWKVASAQEDDTNREAYEVGPTDVAWEDWDEVFGVPRAWIEHTTKLKDIAFENITFHVPVAWNLDRSGDSNTGYLGVLAGGGGDVALRVERNFTAGIDSLAPTSCYVEGNPPMGVKSVKVGQSGFKPFGKKTAEYRSWDVVCANGNVESHRAWVLPISKIAVYEQQIDRWNYSAVTDATTR